MTRRGLASVFVLLLLALCACGKYGPPERIEQTRLSSPAPPDDDASADDDAEGKPRKP